MHKSSEKYSFVSVVVNKPLRQIFHYQVPPPYQTLVQIGQRVRVSFARQVCVGMIIAKQQTPPTIKQKLKPIIEIIDNSALLSPDIIKLLIWVSSYYHHPIGEVILGTLPRYWRQEHQQNAIKHIYYTTNITANKKLLSKLSTIQQYALRLCQNHPQHNLALQQQGIKERTLQALAKKQLLIETAQPCCDEQNLLLETPHNLNTEQKHAVDKIKAATSFKCFLLDGVTGSGKTEVYLQWITKLLAEKKQILLLVPEIALTPQTQQRFMRRLQATTLLLHSELNAKQRAQIFLASSRGEADIIIGTRSAIFVPMPRLGAIIIDEEHDRSFQQEEGLRYSAKSVAIMRAKQADIPILLGSATPALSSLHACAEQRFQHIILSKRAGEAPLPTLRCVDTRSHRKQQGFSQPVIEAIKKNT